MRSASFNWFGRLGLAGLTASALALSACGDDDKDPVGTDTSGEEDQSNGSDSEPGPDVDGSDTDSDTSTSPDVDDTDTTDTTDVAEPEPGNIAVDPLGELPALAPNQAGTVVLMDEEIQFTTGMSPDLAIEVPENTISLSLSLTTEGESGYYAVTTWTGPNDYDLVRDGWALTGEGAQGICFSCDNRVLASDGAYGALAPNNPSATLESGLHTFAFYGYIPAREGPIPGTCGDGICDEDETYLCSRDCRSAKYEGKGRVRVFAKVAPQGEPTTGILDLNLHFTGAGGYTAASAKTDVGFQNNLRQMENIYKTQGISFGTLNYYDIDSSLQVIESLDGPDADLYELFRESSGNPNAVNLFFVRSIAQQQTRGYGVILGIAGGIPGPVLTQGSHSSGVAVAVSGWAVGEIATTMAHEVGHFLGLFHTSEQSFGGQGLHDPLPDTPENDQSYLMFYTGSGAKLSPWQGKVMRYNPFVRHAAP